MDKQEQVKKQPTRMKIIVIILAALLVLSAGGLAGRYIYLAFFAPAHSTATVPDNLIGEEAASSPGWGRRRIIRPHNERRPWFGAAVR